MNSEDEQSLLNAMRGVLAEANTLLPGRVIDYNPETRTADIQVEINKVTADDRVIAAPILYDVPVRWPSAKSCAAIISFPLAAGDTGDLKFAQRSIDEWIETGILTPEGTRTHDLNDAVFYPGTAPQSEHVPAEADCMLIKCGSSVVRMYPDGRGAFEFPAGWTVTTTAAVIKASESVTLDTPKVTVPSGDLEVTSGKLINQGREFMKHTHMEQGDGAPTSPPQ